MCGDRSTDRRAHTPAGAGARAWKRLGDTRRNPRGPATAQTLGQPARRALISLLNITVQVVASAEGVGVSPDGRLESAPFVIQPKEFDGRGDVLEPAESDAETLTRSCRLSDVTRHQGSAQSLHNNLPNTR
jgi:hypothetical protein